MPRDGRRTDRATPDENDAIRLVALSGQEVVAAGRHYFQYRLGALLAFDAGKV
ncbi:hypothetical protein [Mesorhizobium dulcispinae]|uniref:hypothetical protein n=1 Tax=Mesorhizobium dulcispinae TaxID=3072316 RepID=UPI002A2482A8|nr:hypothetical protein [Mesorhizobium sp. VK23D]MDX8521157.1 hypothetical protein [Mesorhizobium sp. VK23D]